MRVIQLGPFPPPHGGVQTNLVALRDFLRARGHRAAVINLTRHRKPDGDEVFYPKGPLETARLLLTEPAAILHLHIGGNLTNRLLALGLFCSQAPGRKSVLTFHSGGYPSSPEGRATTPYTFRAFVIRRFDALIAVNEEIAAFFRQCGARAERIRVISPHSGVEAGQELPQPLRGFFASHSPVLLSVGLLEPEYDLPLQIAALGRVRERHPQAGLAMIGSGSLESDLRARIDAVPYRDSLLLAGDVPHASTLRAIRDCAMLLRTTLYDGDALSVREALELGTPVVASDNGMRPPGCRLVPLSDLDALATAIEETLAAGRRSPEIGSAGAANLEAVLAIYRSLCPS
jgi:glycosyltransferase involved in cell wall biosynthesis